MTLTDVYWYAAPVILVAVVWGGIGIARWRHWL
jgi:hypothetical protein